MGWGQPLSSPRCSPLLAPSPDSHPNRAPGRQGAQKTPRAKPSLVSRVGALANTLSQHTFQTTARVLKQGHALAMWIPGVAPLVSVHPVPSRSLQGPCHLPPDSTSCPGNIVFQPGWDLWSKDKRPYEVGKASPPWAARGEEACCELSPGWPARRSCPWLSPLLPLGPSFLTPSAGPPAVGPPTCEGVGTPRCCPVRGAERAQSVLLRGEPQLGPVPHCPQVSDFPLEAASLHSYRPQAELPFLGLVGADSSPATPSFSRSFSRDKPGCFHKEL